MEKREVTIKQIIGLGYTRDEAINILNSLNPNGNKMEELPF